MGIAVLSLSFTAMVVGAAVQVTAAAGWRLGERRLPAFSAAARRLVTAASSLVALGCVGFATLVVGWFGESVGDCARFSQTDVTNLAIALLVTLAMTAALSGWVGHRSLQGKRWGPALGWELATGVTAFLMFAWLAGGTSC
jgi:hypothetical protein